MKKAHKYLPIYERETRSGTRYQAKYRKGDDSICKTFKTRQAAIDWLKKQELGVGTDYQAYRSMTVSQLSKEWLESKRTQVTPATWQRYESTIRLHIAPELGRAKVQEVSYQRAQKWADDIVAAKSKVTANFCLRTFKAIIAEGVRWGYLAASPIEHLKRYKIAEKEFPFWSLPEKSQFLHWCQREEPESLPVYLTALSTGMRLGEMEGLLWDCVDFQLGQITVKRTYCHKSKALQESTKSKKIRRIPMNPQLKAVLLAIRNAKPASERVFERFPFHKSYVLHKERCRKAGVTEIRFHDLRHTMASHFMMLGGNIYDLQKLLGHSSIEMTERYSHLSPDHLNGVTDFLAVNLSTDNVLHAKF